MMFAYQNESNPEFYVLLWIVFFYNHCTGSCIEWDWKIESVKWIDYYVWAVECQV